MLEAKTKHATALCGTIIVVPILALISCGRETISLVTEVDSYTDSDTTTEQGTDTWEPTDGVDVGVNRMNIVVPAVGDGGSYPAGENVIEVEFDIMNYSSFTDVPEKTEIPWDICFGSNQEFYATNPLSSPLEPGNDFSIWTSITPDGVVGAPENGVRDFCIRTLLPGDEVPQNDEKCFTFIVE